MEDTLSRSLGLVELDAVPAEDPTTVLTLNRVVDHLQANLAIEQVAHFNESLVSELVGRDQATLQYLLLLRH